jgi:nuclear pore complex protein Nup133
MFSHSPQTNPPPSSVRSSRRRQRPLSNEGSLAQPKAKRQRSTLSEQTFIPPDADGAPEMQEAKGHRTAALVKHQNSREAAGPPREIVVRGRSSRSGDRGSKGDGSVVLVSAMLDVCE